jgi:hypothetical protein
VEDWDTAQTYNRQHRAMQIAAWDAEQSLPPEQRLMRGQPRPEPHVTKPMPGWLAERLPRQAEDASSSDVSSAVERADF